MAAYGGGWDGKNPVDGGECTRRMRVSPWVSGRGANEYKQVATCRCAGYTVHTACTVSE